MRRRVIAAVWIAGATVPLLLGTVFLVGCCVLPFHQVVHKLMPICDMAANVMRGEQQRAGHGPEHDALPPSPAREKQDPVKRIATEVPNLFRLAAVGDEPHAIAVNFTTGYRSFITLGALRCDRDVGLHVFVATFLI